MTERKFCEHRKKTKEKITFIVLLKMTCQHTPPCGFMGCFMKRRFWCQTVEDEEDEFLKDRYISNMLNRGVRHGWINPNTSKARGIRITPEYVGPLPNTKRQKYSRKVKKDDTFDYVSGNHRLL